MISITAPVRSYKYFRGDELDPGGDAGGGEEVGEDVGDRPQPTQAGAEDEVFLLLMLMVTLRIKLRMLSWVMFETALNQFKLEQNMRLVNLDVEDYVDDSHQPAIIKQAVQC